MFPSRKSSIFLVRSYVRTMYIHTYIHTYIRWVVWLRKQFFCNLRKRASLGRDLPLPDQSSVLRAGLRCRSNDRCINSWVQHWFIVVHNKLDFFYLKKIRFLENELSYFVRCNTNSRSCGWFLNLPLRTILISPSQNICGKNIHLM
jgi:hypothetical protein